MEPMERGSVSCSSYRIFVPYISILTVRTNGSRRKDVFNHFIGANYIDKHIDASFELWLKIGHVRFPFQFQP
ncbi:unnamed protein product [Nippostrongylus brasiliensis]|uniref:Uncharacterized protein n=1 Tax=Nippostrongylus brasiliensis TaxID=27835 RepID=A0A0N4YZR3_NIPBR|nr:unnamed protein product [Nippostrongylus brasiliensis]